MTAPAIFSFENIQVRTLGTSEFPLSLPTTLQKRSVIKTLFALSMTESTQKTSSSPKSKRTVAVSWSTASTSLASTL